MIWVGGGAVTQFFALRAMRAKTCVAAGPVSPRTSRVRRPCPGRRGLGAFLSGLALVRNAATDLDLFWIDRAGTGLARLTFTRGEDVDPAVG